MTGQSPARQPTAVNPDPDPLAGTVYADLPVLPLVTLPSYCAVTEQAPELDDPECQEYPEDGWTGELEGWA